MLKRFFPLPEFLYLLFEMFLSLREYLILKILMKSRYSKLKNALLNYLGQRGTEITGTKSLGNMEDSISKCVGYYQSYIQGHIRSFKSFHY